MECFPFRCQVCLTTSQCVSKLKKHLRSKAHRQKIVEVFKSDVFTGHGVFPHIILINSQAKKDHTQPIIGLSMLTLCFSQKSGSYFYLCHVCEEKRPPDKILWHLTSGDHCSNYFNYTDPNALSFSWIPSMDMRAILKPKLRNKVKESGPGTLQILDLPEKLMQMLESSTYSEVMHTLQENHKLNNLLEAVKPKRTMIQTYQKDSNRKHPLLGMQHLVECICDGLTEKRHYLCTLCKLTLATHTIIKHVLSFDHIFCYFKEWHPSTLLSKDCYTDYKLFASKILDFSKQTEKIHATANTEMKQVILDPAEYASVNFACYAEALKKLESKTNENEGSSLIISIKPGDKLECCTELTGVSGLSYSIVLRCQDCSLIFVRLSDYLNHLSKRKHKRMFMKCFSQGKRDDGYEQKVGKPHLGLYKYFRDSAKKNQSVFGVSLIVTLISTDAPEAIYVCFACEDSFSESVLKQHLESKKHLINILLYQNPWRLPFAWENHLDMKVLKSVAWEEEKERGPNQAMMMKVLDIPPTLFWRLLPPTYEKVMTCLQLYHTVMKDAVPQRETYSKLQQNERFPLLGKQFMAMYDVEHNGYTRVAFLCLLCERTLLDGECYAHVFSREHVEKFLESFHPGSLTSGIHAETLLDLAKQAARIHSISNVQKIRLDKPIWEPCPYHRAIYILAAAKRRYKQEALEPPITPKMKLVPRETVKIMDKDHVIHNSQKNGTNQPATSSITLMEENKIRQKCTDNSDVILKNNAIEVDPEITNKPCLKSEEHAEEGANNETLALNEKKSEKRKQLLSETTSEERKNTGNDSYQLPKEENLEEPTIRKPSGDSQKSYQNTEKDDGAETGKEIIKSSEDCMCKDGKNVKKEPDDMSEKSQEDTCPDENVEKEMGHKKQQLIFKDDTSYEEQQDKASSGLKQVTTADKGESGQKCHEVAKEKAPSDISHQLEDQSWQYIRKKSREPVVDVEPVNTSVTLQAQHEAQYMDDTIQVVEMEIDRDSEDTLSGTKPTILYPDSTQKKMKIETTSKLLGTSHISTTSSGTAAKLNSNTITISTAPSSSYTVPATKGREITDICTTITPSSTTAKSSCTTAAAKLRDTDYKITAATSSGTAATSRSTASIAKVTATTLNSSMTTTSTASTSSCTVAATKCREITDICTITSSSTTAKSNCTIAATKLRDTDYKITAAASRSTASTARVTATKLNSSTTTTSTASTTSSITAATKLRDTNYRITATASSNMAAASSGTATKLNSSLTTTYTAPTSSCTIAATKCRETDKCTVTTSGSNTVKSSCTTVTTKLRDVDCKSSATTSSTTAAKHNPSITTKSAAPVSNTSTNKCRKITQSTDSLQTVATVTAAKMAETCKNTETSAKNAEVTQHIHVGNPPAVLHLTTALSDRSEHKNPHMEPSHISMTKTKQNENPPKVGISHLIIVSCEGRQQVYCQLCSVRLRNSSHTYSDAHRINYVIMKYPEWNAKPSDLQKIKLDNAVAHLAEVEKDVTPRRSQRIQVNRDVYKELAALPEDKAIEKLKTMMRHRALWETSSPTTDSAETLRQTSVTSISPYEISSPDYEINLPHSEISGFSTNHHPEHENKQEVQKRTDKGSEVTGKKENPAPGHQSASQVLPRTSTGAGTWGCSKLSTFLKVKNTKPIIGLGSVWECQGISLKTFYLCESCRKTLSVSDICQHMVSQDHQIHCMMRHYHKFLYFLAEDNVPEEEKQNILKEIAPMFSAQEHFKKIDAQVVMLTQELYQSIRTAPFSEALKMVQNIKEGKLRVLCQLGNTPQQKETRQTVEKHPLDETAMVRGLHAVKNRKVLGSTDVPSKADLTETHRVLSMHPELRSTTSQHQRPIPALQVKQAEVHSQSPALSTVNPKMAQTLSVSPRDVQLQNRKRPAPPSVERHYTSNSQLKDPWQAKYGRSSLQPVSQLNPETTLESTSANSAATSTLSSPKDDDTGPRYDEQRPHSKKVLEQLIALVKDEKTKKTCSFASQL